MRDDRDGTVHPYLDLLHRLDPKRRSFREGIDVLASDRDRALDTEAAYLWKAYPDERGGAPPGREEQAGFRRPPRRRSALPKTYFGEPSRIVEE